MGTRSDSVRSSTVTTTTITTITTTGSSASHYVAFLQWALPRLQMRWAGFRRVRGQVTKRIDRRIAELGLSDLEAYRYRLEADPDEWSRLDRLCRITISRFYRDRAVWDRLGATVLPRLTALARERGDTALRCWSLGCASGEEPYTLALLWQSRLASTAGLTIRILATDADSRLLERARDGRYGHSSLRFLPDDLRRRFEPDGAHMRIDAAAGADIRFAVADVRRELPDETFHLVLCRNLVFTYFEAPLQRRLLDRLAERIVPGGVLVIGIHEELPAGGPAVLAAADSRGIYSRGRAD